MTVVPHDNMQPVLIKRCIFCANLCSVGCHVFLVALFRREDSNAVAQML